MSGAWVWAVKCGGGGTTQDWKRGDAVVKNGWAARPDELTPGRGRALRDYW